LQSVVEHGDVTAAIDRYVATTTDLLGRVLATTLAAFEQPIAPDPAIALARLSYLVETLLGVAAGGVIGSAITEVLRQLSKDLSPAIRRTLRDALRRIGPARPAPDASALSAVLPSFIADPAARPLVDELGARLHARIARASRDHHHVLISCASAIPAASASSFAATLAQLDTDPMLEHLWAEHLRVAWCHYAAAIAQDRDAAPALPPELATSTACKTWHAWLSRIRGEREQAKPERAPSSEYIMAVM
jgi:hypothetical protein